MKSLEGEPDFLVGPLVSQEPKRRETVEEGPGPRGLLSDGKVK